MAWKANDGSEFTNRMGMVSKNSSLAAKKDSAAPPKTSSDNAAKPMVKSSGQDPSADPVAMQLIDQLRQMGYTGDEVADVMDSGGGSDGGSNDGLSLGSPAAQAAPLQIPGM